jgi:hypothetical protein
MRSRAISLLLLALVAALPVSAEPRIASVRDWTYKDFHDGSAAGSTNNDSGSTLAVYCAADQQCMIFLITSTGCEENGKYTVLVNADSGAMTETAACSKLNNPATKEQFALIFDDFQGLLNTILKDHTIGFSIPLASGMFKVTRFSLEGSNEVLSAVGGSVKESSKPVGLKDQVL